MDIANRIKLINVAKAHLDMIHGELEAARQMYEKMDLLLENAVEIGETAALLWKNEKLAIEDNKEFAMFCVDLAKRFEENFDPDQDDYYETIDDFATTALIEKYGKPAKPEPMKNKGAYYNGMQAICYVPENAESDKDHYSHSRLLALVHGDEKLCKQLFDTLDWQFPETLIDENLRDGLWGECEACGRYYDTSIVKYNECPICHTPIPGDEHYDVAVDKELGYQ